MENANSENANSDLFQKLREAETSRTDEVSKCEVVEKELVELRSKHQAAVDEY